MRFLSRHCIQNLAFALSIASLFLVSFSEAQFFNTAMFQQPNRLELLAGSGGGSGEIDGMGGSARFYLPYSVAVDSSGNIYVADSGNNTIRKITSGGVVTTLAGLAGNSGSTDGTKSIAKFSSPTGVAVDSSGNIYVADSGNNTIRKITSGGVVTTLAGLAGSSGSVDGTGSVARFNSPTGVAVDSSGNVYVADTNNHIIRKVTSAGVVTTFAGLAGNSGSTNGTGSAARFSGPSGVTVDSIGNVYVADTNNHIIRKVTSAGVVTKLAGLPGSSGSTDGSTAGKFNGPTGVTVDSSGNVYVADRGNNTIRKVTSGGFVTTFAGLAGSSGSVDDTGSAARFSGPTGVALDSGGNVYVADSINDTIRKITSAGVVTTFAGLASRWGSADGTGSAARFSGPTGVALDSGGNVYVADSINHTIRKITSAGVVTTLAGLAGNSGSVDGTGSAARFNSPAFVAVDGAGNVYVTSNQTIRKITSSGLVTTLAGLAGTTGSIDGTGGAARFNNPGGLTVNNAGSELYVADTSNHTIRKITSAGVVTTLAGLAGNSGSTDGTGSAARFFYPNTVTVDTSGNVYVADYNNHTIRKITSAGVVTTLAGLAGNLGTEDGNGSTARFLYPHSVAVDSSGNVYVAESYSHTIRKITSAGMVRTIVGQPGFSGSYTGFLPARTDGPSGIAVLGNKVFFSSNHSIWYFVSP